MTKQYVRNYSKIKFKIVVMYDWSNLILRWTQKMGRTISSCYTMYANQKLTKNHTMHKLPQQSTINKQGTKKSTKTLNLSTVLQQKLIFLRSSTCVSTCIYIYIYINVWKSSQRMNLRDVGSETSVKRYCANKQKW